MICAHPYRSPTISGLHEMCAAGGGVFKSYRPRFPFNPNEVIRGGDKSFIFDDPPSPFINDPAVTNPAFSVPQQVCARYLLNGDQTRVGQYKLPFRDTRQFRDLPFLSQVAVFAVFDHRQVKHLGSRGAINILTGRKGVHLPLFAREPRYDAGLDGAEVGHDELAAGPRHKRRPDQLGQHLRNGVVEQLQCVEITDPYERPRLLKIGHVVLRKILWLQ